MMFVNELLARCFFGRLRLLKKAALVAWREPRLPSFNGGSLSAADFLELHSHLKLSFGDFWEIELNHIFYDATRDCILELVELGVRDNVEN